VSPFYSPEVPLPGWLPGLRDGADAGVVDTARVQGDLLLLPQGLLPGFLLRSAGVPGRRAEKDRFWAGKNAAEGYRGERALFVWNNIHRYFLYASIIVVLFLWYEAFRTLFGPQGFQVSIGSLLWFLNIVLLSAYTFSCHSFRHLIGGNKDCYSCLRGGNARRKTYNFVTRLNLRHPQWAWYSLFSLLATDIYMRLLQAGVITDLKIIG
jgi:hypothetical protein